MATFRFTAGPWNIHEGNETFGPGHRKSIPLEEKMKKYAEIGLAGMQFHDDDAVPDMNNMTEKQIIDYAKDVKAMLDKYGLLQSSSLRVCGSTSARMTAASPLPARKTANSPSGVPAAPAISPRHSAPTRSSCGWPVKAPSAPKARTPSR